jgi:site-specific DNA-cytosine methylase
MPPEKRPRQERDSSHSPSAQAKRTRHQSLEQTDISDLTDSLKQLTPDPDAKNPATDARLADDVGIQAPQPEAIQPQASEPLASQPQASEVSATHTQTRQAQTFRAQKSQPKAPRARAAKTKTTKASGPRKAKTNGDADGNSVPPTRMDEVNKILASLDKQLEAQMRKRGETVSARAGGKLLALKPIELTAILPPTRIAYRPARAERLFNPNVHINETPLEPDEAEDEDDEADDDDDDEGRTPKEVRSVTDAAAFPCAMAKKRCPAWLRSLLACPGSRSRPMSSLISRNESRIHSVIRYKTKRSSNETAPQSRPRHLDYGRPPVSDIYKIFEQIASKAVTIQPLDSTATSKRRSILKEACEAIQHFGLRVFTMCSGTEAPILALELIREQLEKENLLLNYKHIASAEIEPEKQGYIELNFEPPLLFRDVTEFRANQATTAYGALTNVPGDCHIVIAGSACVDYSSLSRTQKEFGVKGESYSTMSGVLAYCRKHSPSMVLLENVKGAPWMKGQKNITKIWRKAGYDVAVIYVDTKDYYIPQTRQRGYLLGFNHARAEAQGFDTMMALKKWIGYIRALTSRATAPYTAFIYNNDSTENEIMRRRCETAAVASKKEINWALCRQRYYALRSSNSYGQLRPFTRWDANGTSTCFDFVWQLWMRMQRDRVLDTLDIAFLRYLAERDYDMNGKSRTVDLSQNIDRDLDSKHWGIVGCLTGTGLLYDTYRGGVISGDEALKLQGIPVDDLVLDNLSNKTKVNLAGNAMTSTVVGTALICAIMAGVDGENTIFHQPADRTLCSEYKYSKDQTEAAVQDPKALGLTESDTPLWTNIPVSVDNLAQAAWESRQLCACEGLSGEQPIETITICKECGHTVCATCRGQPYHHYEGMKDHCNYHRANPREFISYLEHNLPRSLIIENSEGFQHFFDKHNPFPDNSSKHGKAWPGHGSMATDISKQMGIDQDLVALRQSYRQTVINSISKPFHYRGIKRDTSWKVEFSSSVGRLVLIIQPIARRPCELPPPADAGKKGMDCQWLLYATCDSEVALGSRLREVFAEPVARLKPKVDLFSGQWEVREERGDSATAVIVGSDSGEALESQTRSGIQMKGLKSLKVFNTLQVTITSDPGNSDFCVSSILGEVTTLCRLGECGTSNDLLYRASQTIGGKSMYLLLGAGHLQDAKYDSMVLAFDHERLPRGDVRSSVVKFASGWRPVFGEDCASFRGMVRCDQILWTPLASMTLSADTRDVSIWSVGDPILFGTGCTQDCRLALSVDLPKYDELENSFGGVGKFSVDLQDRRGRLKPLSFVLGSVEPPPALAGPALVRGPFNLGQACEDCAPAPLRLQWRWVRSRGSVKKVIRPLEDPDEARLREAKVKERPRVAAGRLQLPGSGDGSGGHLQVDLNPMALVHRAVAPIQRYGSWNSHIEAEWCIRTYHDLDVATSFLPAPLLSTEDEPEVESAGFRRDLYERQKKTLGWMTEVEKGKTEWKEENIKEFSIKILRWNVLARAWRSVPVRGGVLADGIGTGKTTVALSLVGRDLSNSRQVSDETTRAAVEVRRASTTATLVLVPANLVPQWMAQAAECFTDGVVKRIIRIDKFLDLQAYALESLASAPIILMSLKVFEDGRYWNHLGDMCYAPDVPATNGRALRQWIDVVDGHLNELYDNSQQFQDADGFKTRRTQLRFDNEYASNANDYHGFRKKDMKNLDPTKLDIPSGELSKQDRQALYPANALDEKHIRQYGELIESDHDTLFPHPHMLFFRRIIVDEFQYLSPTGYVAVQTLKSSTRWLISGTPPLHDVDGVDATARLLGTRITSRPDDVVSQGFDLGVKANSKIVDRSYVEEFTDYSDFTSIATKDLHNKLCADFAHCFVRCNEPDTSKASVKEHVIAVRPQTRELLAFIHFYTTLNNQAVKYATSLSEPTTLHDLIVKESNYKPWRPVILCTISGAIVKAFAKATNAEMALLTCYTTYAMWQTSGENKGNTTKDPAAYWTYMTGEIDSLLHKLKRALREATHYWTEATDKPGAKYENEKNDLPHWATDVVRRGNLGDADITWFIDELLGYANDNSLEPTILISNLTRKPNAQVPRDSYVPKTRNAEMNKRCSEIAFIVDALLSAIRQARFFRTVEAISDLQGIHCDACERGFTNYGNYNILSTCGHVCCHECLEKLPIDKLGACLVRGCDRAIEKSNLYPAAVFSDTAPYSDIESRGSAVASIIKKNVFNNVEKPTDAQEYAVIFVQYMAHLAELTIALDESNISYINACVKPTLPRNPTRDKGEENARDAIEQFKLDAMLGNRTLGEDSKAFSRDLPTGAKDTRKAPNPHVLILMLDSEDAAGWNLQVCNHVIFAAPYVTPTKVRYEMVMKQAVGRASRNGQNKVVHVYHVALARTTETAILSERMGNDRDLVWVDSKVSEFAAGWVVKDKKRPLPAVKSLLGPKLNISGIVQDDEDGEDGEQGDEGEAGPSE